MKTRAPLPVNNEIYKTYGDRWYTAHDDPVAILRAETRAKLPWILEQIKGRFPGKPVSVLDVGCGGGFVSNPLAREGLQVTGLDAARDSLEVARRYDCTRRVRYVEGDACRLPFAAASFDVVTQMDLLEHVEEPAVAVAEAARVLRPGGLLLVQTLNRNWFCGLVAIKLVECLVASPEHVHVLRLFIKPGELRGYCARVGLEMGEMVGLRPRLRTIPLRNLWSGVVPEGLEFSRTRLTWLSYMGAATKAQ